MIKKILLIFFFLVAASPLRVAADDSKGGLGLIDSIKMTLELEPNIKIQEMVVQSSRGALQQQKGAFDITLSNGVSNELVRTPFTKAQRAVFPQIDKKSKTDITVWSSGLNKKFRTGQTANLSMSVTRTGDRTHYNPFYPVPTPTNKSNITFTLTQPLLQGRGRDVTTAFEESARLEKEASNLDLTHTISQRILNTILAYWNYAYAVKKLKILKATEERAKVLVERTRKLIAADEVPAADINQLIANVEDKTASRISGEHDLYAARQSLGASIGVSSSKTDALPLPAETLDDLTFEEIPSLSATRKYTELALSNRTDYEASKKREESAKKLLVYYKNQLLPQLDLNMSVGSSGLFESGKVNGFFNSIDHNVYGSNYKGEVSFSYPFGNNSDRGALLKQEAVLGRQTILTNDLARTIGINISTKLSLLFRSKKELERAEAAHRLYKLSFENEKKKYKLGSSTLIDIITYEDRLTGSLLTMLGSRLKLINAISNILFETGSLIESRKNNNSVNRGDLIRIPIPVQEKIKESNKSGGTRGNPSFP